MRCPSSPAAIDRIRHDLVGLKMPRAMEALGHVVRRLENGEIAALEAIDILLSEELTLRENSRIKTALRMGRLATIKTLAGFDFSFLARPRPDLHARPARVRRPLRSRPFPRPARQTRVFCRKFQASNLKKGRQSMRPSLILILSALQDRVRSSRLPSGWSRIRSTASDGRESNQTHPSCR